MKRRIRFLKAYGSVFIILGSYVFLGIQKKILGPSWAAEKKEILHRRNARRIEKAILDLKGLFIKVGQMLSIMSNFLPEAFTQGLEGLQDSVPPHPYEAIEERFREDFGKTPQEMFRDFEKEPIASASLGQVHIAHLKDGAKVAVKVQYPEIDEIVRSDVKILKRIFWILHLFFPAYGLKSVYAEVAEVVMQELDYRIEGKNLELVAKNFEKEESLSLPRVFWDYSSPKILTLEFMEGVKISALNDLKKSGVDPTDVATKIIHAFCKQIFIDGVYHADPHPGNLLVRESRGDVKIVMLDFGATAKISERMRHGITLFAEGLIKRDTKMLANAVRDMGFIARPDSFEPFDQLVDYFYEKFANLKIENFRKLDLSQFQNLDDLLELRKINISFRDLMTSFHVPKDWILLERTLLLTMGLCAHLDPKLNPIEIVLPYVENFVLQDKTLAEMVMTMMKEIVSSYLQLPHEIRKTLKKLNEGKLAIKSPDTIAHSQRLYILGHQILYGFLGVSGLFLSFYCKANGLEIYGDYALYGSGFFGLILIGSLFRNRT